MTREEILAQPLVVLLNQYLSIATIVALVALVVWAVTLVIHDKNALVRVMARHATLIALLVSAFGMFMSLFYSEVLHLEPCELCWYQRVLLYPQVVMFAIAWWRKEHSVWIYSVFLSGLGAFIALYHHSLQMGYDLYKPCSTAPFAVDCSRPEFINYGFVTFPLMSLTLFATLILLYVTHKRSPREEVM